MHFHKNGIRDVEVEVSTLGIVTVLGVGRLFHAIG